MRFRTLEIRWHDSKPISTCDFQPAPFKRARPTVGNERAFGGQAYKLATGGEDNHVRVWMVHPHIRPPELLKDGGGSSANAPRPPRVEYLATLSRHSAAVNVVRFSPNGELIASAGDDGMIIIWAPSATPQASTYGSDLSPEELQHEKEYWKPRTTFRCTTMQVYDLAWSPTGEYLIAGSTDNTARIFSVDGKCLQEIAEHTHYVQGVAWDPLNEYIATQSSDRSMHIYQLSFNPATGMLDGAHAVGRNSRLHLAHHKHNNRSRNPSRPRVFRSQSISGASEAESASEREDAGAPPTPASAVSSSAQGMFPPPPALADAPSSRRSSFSAAPSSPSPYIGSSRYARSPSPMPPLPAIRLGGGATVKLYGDESHTNFFRRLTFSPDGGLLLTPAGQFEDPTIVVGAMKGNKAGKDEVGGSGTPGRGRKGRPSALTAAAAETEQEKDKVVGTSSVYIYSRANFARPPVAQLPGHKKASIAVRFSPILYQLRPGVGSGDGVSEASSSTAHTETQIEHHPKAGVANLEKGKEGILDVDVLGSVAALSSLGSLNALIPPPPPHRHEPPPSGHGHHASHSSASSSAGIVSPTPRSGANSAVVSPVLSPLELRPPTPAPSKPPTPLLMPQTVGMQTPTRGGQTTGGGNGVTSSVFALGYRMLFAVLTMDAVAVYDTQQAGPVCLLTKLHYDEFTDVAWSPDGQCLMLASRDGYCTLLVFDEILPAHHVQQHTLQLHSIAQHHSVPLAYSTSSSTHHHREGGTPMMITPLATPMASSIALPALQVPVVMGENNPKKRLEPPLTPAASVEGGSAEAEYFPPRNGEGALVVTGDKGVGMQEPPKKKRRVALTRVGDLGS